MKIALAFLFTFVSLSCQQAWYPTYPVPQALFYANPAAYYFYRNSYLLQNQLSNDHYMYDNLEDTDKAELLDSYVQGRVAGNKMNPFQGRFFYTPGFFSRLTSTMTIYRTVSSIATVFSLQSCISSNMFSTSGTPTPSPIITCSRRRRDVLEQLVEEPISPSNVEPVIASVMPRMDLIHDQPSFAVPEVESSLSHSDGGEALARQSRAFTFMSTTISTITSYSFITTTIRKFFTLASSTGLLLCIPPGYTAC